MICVKADARICPRDDVGIVPYVCISKVESGIFGEKDPGKSKSRRAFCGFYFKKRRGKNEKEILNLCIFMIQGNYEEKKRLIFKKVLS